GSRAARRAASPASLAAASAVSGVSSSRGSRPVTNRQSSRASKAASGTPAPARAFATARSAARAGIPASSHIVPGRQGPIVRQDRGNGGDRNLDHIVFRLKNGQPLQPEPRLGNRPGQQAV